MKKALHIGLIGTKVACNVMTILFGISLVGSNIALANAGAISGFLGQATQKAISSGDDVNNLWYLPNYFSIEDVKDNAGYVIQKISEEGITLLKNEGNALPLATDAKVNLYSSSSVNYISTGGGSSFAKGSVSEVISLKDGLEKAGLRVNKDLWDWYSSNSQYYNNFSSSTSSDAQKYEIRDAKWSEISTESKNNEAEAGIFVLSRFGTEASDLKFTGATTNGYTNGDCLELAPSEIDVLKNMKALKDSGKIKKIVVLLNSVNQVQLDYAFDSTYGIDAIVWVGEGGTTGTKAIGNILNGKVNPSGKLPDTYFKQHYLNPVYANFGDHLNEGEPIPGGTKSTKNVVYQEGIYNGYRYVETRYFDKVCARENVGEFSYDDAVAYPFGYGLSYTTFSYSGFTVKYDEKNDEYTLSVKVTNDGTRNGKESVSFFLSKPYTDYDVENHIEKSAVDFVGYAKTASLEPKDSEVVSLVVSGDCFASYDSNKAKTYIVDEGKYYFTAAHDAHDATKNILTAMSKTSDGNADLVKTYDKNFDNTTYATSNVTGKAVTNQFDNADLNLYEHKGDNSVNYISRNNWNGTVKLGITEKHAALSNATPVKVNSGMVNDAQKLSSKIEKDNVEYPKYNVDSGIKLASLLSVVDGKKTHVEYDDERWEKILDQLTFDDQVMLLSNGLRKTYGLESISKPLTIDGNGALGPVGGQSNKYSDNDTTCPNRYAFLLDDEDQDTCPYQYPCSALVAATRNDALVEELGDAIGEDCLWCGYSGLYGLGVNIHRGMYSGRAFEYYSEDGVLSGLIASSQVKGIRARGVYVYMKHAILNDQEKNREGVNTWANEQTIREIYLKPFEIAIKKGGAENIMTGFNRIGVVWTSQQGFINNVLRDEFGMMGFGVSDYWQSGYMNLTGNVMGGCALPDGDTAASASKSELYAYKEGYGNVAWAMREETHRILYVIVNSSAMNGYDASTIFVAVTPEWISILNGACTAIDIIFGISVAAFLGLNVWCIIDGRKKRNAKV